MNVGYAQQVITPSLEKPVFLAGFGSNRRAQGIHDDLYARALALQTEHTTLVLVALDLLGFIRPDVQDVLRRVHIAQPDAKVILAATHTHHGPDTIGMWGPDRTTRGVDEEWMSKIKEQIVETILASLSDLKPASVKSTSVHIPGLVKNTRNPGIIDDELTIAQFVRQNVITPYVTLMNFPCHPEALWEHNPHITSDYVHYLREKAEKETSAPCIFFVGALGGMLTPDVKDHSFAEAEYMGRKLAEEGLMALHAVEDEWLAAVRVQKKEISAELTNVLYKAGFEQGLLTDTRDEMGQVHTEVNLIQIGDLWFATVPGELLPKLGLQLKASMKESGAKVAGVIGLANDELGYILPAEDFEFPPNPFEPGKHYEETNSNLKSKIHKGACHVSSSNTRWTENSN
jgi:hypothetical protein